MDLRVEKTRAAIINAFLALRAKKPLEKITVKELCALARINKSTFYTHFADLYALADTLETEVVASILAGIVTNMGLYTINLMVMGWSANVSLLRVDTIFSLFEDTGLGGQWHEALLAGFVTILAGALLVLFLGTRLGLSIRATGDNIDMVRASSINPTFTITVGLCISNALTALSGAMVGQYQNTADINGGTGIVVIGLACLIIGETVLGRRSVLKGAIAAVIGSIIYRFIYAIVLYTKIMPVQGLRLATAVIVALAIAFPTIKSWAAFQKRKMAARQKGGR